MDFLPGLEGEGLPRVLACFTAALLEKKPMKLVDGGNSKRTFLAVEEAIEALQLMLEKPGKSQNQIFNLGHPGNETTIVGLAEMMRNLTAELTEDMSYRSHPLQSVSAREFYGEGYADSDRRMPSIDHARKQLGWEPKKRLREILRPILQDAIKTHLSLSVQRAQ
jgi:UDP-apiose/xylose synthase